MLKEPSTPITSLQHHVNQALPQITRWYSDYALSDVHLQQIKQLASDFQVRLPLVGMFSSGKTSLINALAGEKWFAVEVTPETSLPLEIRYAGAAQFTGHSAAGAEYHYTAQQVFAQQWPEILPTGWVTARLPLPVLKAYPQLTLVDMPGWESGIVQHSQAIDAWLDRSLAYALVVSAEEGVIRKSLQVFVKELAARNMPAILVITKTDKKPPEERDAVIARLTTDVTALLGEPPLAVVAVCSRKKDTAAFGSALADLNQRVDERYWHAVAQPLITQLMQLSHYLGQLCDQDNQQLEEIALQRDVLTQEATGFRAQLQLREDELDRRVEAGILNIEQQIHNALLAESPGYAISLMHNSDITESLLATVRLTIARSAEQVFSGELKKYLHDVAADMPLALSGSTVFSSQQTAFSLSPELSNFFSGSLMALMTRLIGALGWQGKILVAVQLLLGELLGGLFRSGNQRLQEAQQRTEAERHVNSRVIPEIMKQISPQFRQPIMQQVKQLQA